MTNEQLDSEIGRVVRERRNAKQKLECIERQLSRIAVAYRQIAGAIEADKWQALPNLEFLMADEIVRLPDVDELSGLLKSRRDTRQEIQRLEQSAKRLDID